MKTWTIKTLLEWAKGWLEEKNIESPRLNSELMLCKVLSFERIELYTKFDRPLSENELSEFKSLIKRRASREPLQYIIGNTKFCGLDIELDKSVLIPRPETEEIIEYLSKLNLSPSNILDIGTGSGCLSLALADLYKSSKVISIDVSSESLSLAQDNSKRNNIKNITFQQLNILESIPNIKFDLVISNPPYVSLNDYENLEPELLNFEPRIALTDSKDGLSFYKRYSEILPRMLNKNGKAIFEHGLGQESQIKKMFSDLFLVESIKDFQGINRFIALEYK